MKNLITFIVMTTLFVVGYKFYTNNPLPDTVEHTISPTGPGVTNGALTLPENFDISYGKESVRVIGVEYQRSLPYTGDYGLPQSTQWIMTLFVSKDHHSRQPHKTLDACLIDAFGQLALLPKGYAPRASCTVLP
jgi:hypothetical protein